MSHRPVALRLCCFAFVLLALVGFSASAEVARLTVALAAPSGVATLPEAVAVVLEPQGQAGDQPMEIVAELAVGGELTLELPVRTLWRLTLRSTELWAAPEVVFVTAEAQRVALTAHEVGWARGRWVLEEGASPTQVALPESFRLRVESVPEAGVKVGPSRAVARVEESCLVGEGGRFLCRLPAGRLDLRLRARGFVSHYLWAVEIPPRGEAVLGRRELRRGASVVGWVEGEGEGFRTDQVRIQLERRAAASGLETQRHRLEALELRAKVNERGFFEMGGVSPGGYRLRVSHPGFAEARVTPLDVHPGAETEILAVRLQPPALLDLEVAPRRDPYGKPWLLRLSREGSTAGFFEPVAEGRPPENGAWRSEPLDPGRYRVELLDSRVSRWSSEEVELSAGTIVTHRMAVALERVEGTVWWGSEPLPVATLRFQDGKGAAQVASWTRDDGRYYAFLPRRDRWIVEVSSRTPPVAVTLVGEVTQRPEETSSLMDLEVPYTEIEGEVVDSYGVGVGGARVLLTRQDGAEVRRAGYGQITTDADGKFQVLGLAPGRWRVEASAQPTQGSGALAGRHAPPSEVILEEEEPPPPLRLVLEELAMVRGRVLSPTGGGLPGAIVVATAAPIASVRIPRAVTDIEGHFELPLPRAVETVMVTVFPPGFAAFQARLPVGLREPTVLVAEPWGGRVKIVGDWSGWREQTSRLPVLFGEAPWGFGDLEAWARMHGYRWQLDGGEPLVVPALAPGRYRLCRASLSSACVEGELVPFGELALVLPEVAPPF